VSFFGGLFRGIKKVVGVVAPVLKFIPGPIGAAARGVGLIGKGLNVVRTLSGARPQNTAMPGGATLAMTRATSPPTRQRTATRAAPRRAKKRKLKFGSPAWRRKYMRRGRR
jgi:hypothetical protein